MKKAIRILLVGAISFIATSVIFTFIFLWTGVQELYILGWLVWPFLYWLIWKKRYGASNIE